MDELYQQLKNFGHVKANVLLSKYTTFRIGGPAQFLIEIDEKEKLIKLLNWLRAQGVSFFVLGGGSNLLFSDDDFEGVVVKISFKNYVLSGDKIIVDAGTNLGLIVNMTAQNSLSGLEWAAGVPGTVGGAVRGNAGAFGGCTADNIETVTVWRDGEILELKKQDCHFDYRESIFKSNGDVVLSVTFKFVLGDQQKILAKMQENIKYRVARFAPHPSAGSFFKNISLNDYKGDISVLPEKARQVGKVGAAWFIEQAGLKGYAVGGAKISDEHANFLINFNNATSADVLTLVEDVKEKVYNKFGVELEPEVQIVK